MPAKTSIRILSKAPSGRPWKLFVEIWGESEGSHSEACQSERGDMNQDPEERKRGRRSAFTLGLTIERDVGTVVIGFWVFIAKGCRMTGASRV